MNCYLPYTAAINCIERPFFKATESSVALLVAIAYFWAGADTIAVSFPFGQLKLATGIFLCLYFLLGRHIYYTRGELLCVIGIVASCIFSSLYSVEPSRSIAYTFLLLFNIVCVASVGKALFSLSPEGFKAGLVLCARAQIFAGIFIAALGLQARISLFFYEPSFWAIALTPYLYITAKKHIALSWPDWILILIAVQITKSANLMLLVLVAIIVSNLSSLSIKSLARMTIFLTIIGIGLGLYSQIGDDLVASTVRRILESDNVFQQCVERGGNRYPRMLVALDVFQNNVIHGIGPGAYASFNKAEAIRNSYPEFFPYHNIAHSPATNVFIEMAAEGGIVLLFSFLCYLFCGLTGKGTDATLRNIVIVMLIGLLLESSMQRSYFWLLLGAASFTYSGDQPKTESWRVRRRRAFRKKLLEV